MEDKEIYIHPIFNELLNNFRFFLAGINMMSMPDFQKALINGHKGEKSELEISVKYDDLKCLKYDIRDILTSFNKSVELKLIGDKVEANIVGLMNFQARQIAISLFDILQFSKYQNYIIKNNSTLFKFAKHIRNGAAHNNKFFFDEKNKLDLPVGWRGKTIEESFHLQKIVFNEFLTPADLVLLISDFSFIIKNYK
ncbi:MAG: hypothetical protein V1716_03300 [Candidatus Uhrbacteria bacterium]